MNFYKVLDVDPNADAKTIKAAFYDQSKKFHPDMKPEDGKAPDKFKELVEAYEVLSDPKKRSAYDELLGIGKKKPPPWEGPIRHQVRSKMQHGVDPYRDIKVDLSEDRMNKAWKAYNERWKREEAELAELEEKKMLFRFWLDRKRESYDNMSEEERAYIRECMTLRRHPDYMQNPPDFWNNVRKARQAQEPKTDTKIKRNKKVNIKSSALQINHC